jgi:acyl carrier protein phosphodiesterase
LNYLAHAYLSFQNPEILVGNMISDYVKGSAILQYNNNIQSGIKLHRAIDAFTDAHPELIKAKQVFRPVYRLYSAAFIDVVLDHYLALLLTKETDFFAFTQQCYVQLQEHQSVFPLPFLKMFPNMVQNNWLFNYQFTTGIEKSFGGLQRRAKYIEEVDSAIKIFNDNYDSLGYSFAVFWKDMLPFAKQQYKSLTNSLPTPYI